ncbi:tRNA 2-selenouridine(34) synthase MnmH [Metabacillus sp. RGM 3146]|uniref:tRNA 2-selenouridine(34) synthase MnmH n=1 Tax=Metabacillus sp. RGM 3146 TaxID=3401092 RepID=UPI003B99DA2D
MFQDIMVDEMVKIREKRKLVLIDVRSPSEYRAATIPGSCNIPLFTDEERAEIGTLYKQTGVQAAKDKGLEVVSRKLPAFIKEFAAIEGEKAVFCWRGGMRSRTSATVLDLMGIKAYRLHGGVRAYRKWIVDTIEHMKISPKAYVLNGYTGSGKTKILNKLQDEDYPVIDLEGMANHRGSIFGQIGLDPHNQKMFDALFAEKVLTLNQSPYVLFEAESKRVGKVILPESIMEKKEEAVQIFVSIPLEERVRHILEDYQPEDHQEECLQAFRMIKNRIHTPVAAKIEEDLLSGAFSSAIKLLLEFYYDPRYDHTARLYPEDHKIVLEVNNSDEALKEIKKILRLNFSPASSGKR